MPPRQPLKPRTPAKKPVRKTLDASATAALAASLLEPSAKPAANRAPSFSPYPDLAMAIEMLNKRAKNLAAQPATEGGDRHSLILKWVESLTKIQDEMQKLHKLEILANRLISPK